MQVINLSALKKYFCLITNSMAVIIILLTASISVAAIFLVAFLWSVRDKQFEDDYSPAVRILFETPVKHPAITDTLTEDKEKTETEPYAGR